MSKFVKRLKKLNPKARNVLVLGDAFGNVADLADYYKTVFIIDDVQKLRKGNVVYRENFDNITLLTDVDIVIVNSDKRQFIMDIAPIWKRFSPLIIIGGSEPLTKEYNKFLASHRYHVTEILKHFYIYKII